MINNNYHHHAKGLLSRYLLQIKFNRTGHYIGFLTMVALSFLTGCTTDELISVEHGVSLELAKSRKQQISKVNYDIRFTIPDEKDQPIAGEVLVTFHLASNETPVIFDFNVPVSYLNTLYVNDVEVRNPVFINEHIIIDESTLKPGNNKVDIKFRAGDLSLNRNEEYLYTLFVPDRASTAFPCFDQPDIKARFKLELVIPDHWVALSNAPVISESASNEQLSIQFDWSDLMSTYLFSFVAGEFEVVNRTYGDLSMNMLHREKDSVKLNENVQEIFDLHYDALKWLEDYTKIEYPFKKFDFALIPGFQYGGMEHVGAVQYRASRLMLDPSATLNDKINRSMLIAHETAHMWFGNLVTMQWFDDVWMKEVFANFMASKITEPNFPDVNHELKFLFAHYPQSYSVDRTTGANAIRQPLNNLKNAGSLYGSIIYHKAPIVMKQLETKIGSEPFKQAIRQYLDNYANKNATWDDLVEIFDLISDKDIKKWSNAWVKEPGMPYIALDVNAFESDRSYRIVQYDLSGNNRVWPQDFKMRMEYELGESEVWVKMNAADHIIKSGPNAEVPRFIRLNSNASGYGVFSYGVDYVKDEFLFNRARVNIPYIKPDVSRGVTYITLHEFLLYEGMNPQLYLSFLGDYIKLEENKLILDYLLDNYKLVFWKFMPEQYRSDNAVAVESVLWEKLISADDPELKNLILTAYIDMGSSQKAIDRFHRMWSGKDVPEGIILSENDRINLSFELAVKDSLDGFEVVKQQIQMTTNTDKKNMMEFVLPALSNNESTRDDFFNSLMNPSNREHESWVLSALKYLHHPLRLQKSQKYLTPSLNILEELQRTGDIFFPKRWLENTLWAYHSTEASNAINLYLEQHADLDPKLRQKVLQAADMVFKAERDVTDYLNKE